MELGILPRLLGYQLRRAQQRVFQDFAASLGEFGVTPGQVGLLVMASANPGVSQAALARALGVERASLGETVKHLVSAGLVERVPSASDRRSHALYLTVEGEALLAAIVPRIHAHEASVAGALSAAERRTLVDLLDRLAGTRTEPSSVD